MSDIPDTTRFRPRPVWARILRREDRKRYAIAEQIDPTIFPDMPPSDAEKRDAILVLKEATGVYGAADVIGHMLHVEAQRIMDEATDQVELPANL